MGWKNNLFQLLIIEDTAGFSGLFVYAPAPGHGNLIGSWTAQAGTDPYGNAYPAGLNVTVGSISGTTFSGTDFLIGPAGEFFYSGVPALGNLFFSIAPAAGTDSFGNAYKGPGAFFYSGSGDGGYIGLTKSGPGQVFIQIGNTAAGASPAFLELTANTLAIGWPGNGGQVQLSSGNPGFFTVASPMFAVGGTPANPTLITTDSWTNFTLTAGSAGTDINGTSYPPAYMLTPTGDVKLRGVLVTPGGGLPAGTTWATIPAAYRPATNIPVALISNATAGTLAHVYIRPNGNVQFDAALGGTFNMYLDCTLNVQGT